MKKFNGTQGLWKAKKFKNMIEIGNEQSRLVCTIQNESEQENKANAKLIENAPELFIVLNEMFDLLEEHQPNWYLRQDYFRIKNVLESSVL